MTRLARAGATAFTAMVVAAAIGLIVFVVVIPRASGGAALTVLSGSMTPTYPVGSIVLVVPTDPMTIKPGDVITYQTAPGVAEYVTHRVMRIQHDTTPMSFVTKGDANRGEDTEPVPVGAVRGTVRMHVPYLGTISDYVRTPVGLALLLMIPAGWFIASQTRSIVNELRGRAAPTSFQKEMSGPRG
jgi:signal peptidase I